MIIQMDFREFIADGGEFDGAVPITLEGEDRGELKIALKYLPYCQEDKTDCPRQVCFLGLFVLLFEVSRHVTLYPL